MQAQVQFPTFVRPVIALDNGGKVCEFFDKYGNIKYITIAKTYINKDNLTAYHIMRNAGARLPLTEIGKKRIIRELMDFQNEQPLAQAA